MPSARITRSISTAAWAAAIALLAGAAGQAGEDTDEEWDECYRGAFLPEEGGWPWSLSAGATTAAAVEGGRLRITDPGTAKGELVFYNRQWYADHHAGGVVEARVKVISCSGQSGVILMVADGVREVAVTFYPNRIAFAGGKPSFAMDTVSAFHTYRLELRGSHVRLAVDGVMVVDEPCGLAKPAHNGRNLVGFGSCSSPAIGEALWEFVRHRTLLPPARLVTDAEHVLVYKKPGVYACFPGLRQLPGDTLCTRNRFHRNRPRGDAGRTDHRHDAAQSGSQRPSLAIRLRRWR